MLLGCLVREMTKSTPRTAEAHHGWLFLFTEGDQIQNMHLIDSRYH